MKFPDRLIGEVAAHASFVAGKTVSQHTILLALGFSYRAEKGKSLNEVVAEFGFTRRYGRAIAQLFGITFSDFTPRVPNNLPME
jgi:hypothetical protein